MASTPAFALRLQILPLLRSPVLRLAFRFPHRCASELAADDPSSSPPTAFVSGSSPAAEETGRPKSPTSLPPSPAKPVSRWIDQSDFRQWKEKEEILKDIEGITALTKDILHSDRYHDGERLCVDDETEVIEKLLMHHPHAEDKIGCGLDYIMVDRHPQFRNSRCLFVVRTNGVWIDFSYQKCLRAYIQDKYPTSAEKFIREHFKRS